MLDVFDLIISLLRMFKGTAAAVVFARTATVLVRLFLRPTVLIPLFLVIGSTFN
jgi:hypothetical protein